MSIDPEIVKMINDQYNYYTKAIKHFTDEIKDTLNKQNGAIKSITQMKVNMPTLHDQVAMAVLSGMQMSTVEDWYDMAHITIAFVAADNFMKVRSKRNE